MVILRALGICMLVSVLLCGCSVSEMSTQRVHYAGSRREQADERSTALFADDETVMSDEAIERILYASVAIPEDARLVVLNYGNHRRHDWWSEEISNLDQEAVNSFLEAVRQSDRIVYASVLPSMVAPARQSVPYMRKAAARCQADLIFLYRTISKTYRRQRVLADDQTKAYCVVEAVMIDTRTGIVPFATAVVKTYTAVEGKDDFNSIETRHKAELKAAGEALSEIGQQLVEFLASVPEQDEIAQEVTASN